MYEWLYKLDAILIFFQICLDKLKNDTTKKIIIHL